MLDSDIADTANSGGAFAGAITAALFLQKFVPDDMPWAHFDTYAWRATAKPGRPKGGEALGLRAVFRYLTQVTPSAKGHAQNFTCLVAPAKAGVHHRHA